MNWKKIFVVIFNVIIGAYLLLAVTAFVGHSGKDRICSDLRITIDHGVGGGFLTPAEVRNMLNGDKLNPMGKRLADVNLRQMEERLQTQELIRNAECYKTQDGSVAVRITERVPVVRVMASGGDDYYVDKEGHIMQNTGYACDLMVATGHIGRDYARRVLSHVGSIIMADNFWRNQIEQVNVLADSTIEMVPRVGKHIIYLGKPTGITRKLERLRLFYLHGLSQAGWNKYSRISVEFNNQIVCKRR